MGGDASRIQTAVGTEGGAAVKFGSVAGSLARISRVFKDADFRSRLLRAPSAAEIFRTIAEEDAKH